MNAASSLLLFILHSPVVLVRAQWTIASAGHVQKRIVQKLKCTFNCITISGQFDLLTTLYSFEGRTRLNIQGTKKISGETERRLEKGKGLLLSNSHHVSSFNFVPYRDFTLKQRHSGDNLSLWFLPFIKARALQNIGRLAF